MARLPDKTPFVPGGTEHRRIGDYIVVGSQPLGRGSYGQVWKAYHKHQSPDRLVAIKEVFMERYTTPKMKEYLYSEVANVKKINHPNVVRFLTTFQVPETNNIYLVMEYCSGGDLYEYMEENGGSISEEKARSLMRQLGTGLLALKDKGVIHRDLKPQNILLSTRGPDAVPKIADFGFSKAMCSSRAMAESSCGTVVYSAPEVLLDKPYNGKVDLWSAGVILYELVLGRRPFGDDPHAHKVLERIESTTVRLPAPFSPECNDMCCKLLRKEPAQRMNHEQFVAHPFVQGTRLQYQNNVNPSPSTYQEAIEEDIPPYNRQTMFGCKIPILLGLMVLGMACMVFATMSWWGIAILLVVLGIPYMVYATMSGWERAILLTVLGMGYMVYTTMSGWGVFVFLVGLEIAYIVHVTMSERERATLRMVLGMAYMLACGIYRYAAKLAAYAFH